MLIRYSEDSFDSFSGERILELQMKHVIQQSDEKFNEFIGGLQILTEAVLNLENTELIIRIRPNIECRIESFGKLLNIS